MSGTSSGSTERTYGYGQGILSNSILSTASRCGYQYRVKYKEGRKTSKTFSYFVIGNMVHYSIDDYMQTDLSKAPETGDTESFLMDRYHHYWREKFDQKLLSEIQYVARTIESLKEEAREMYGKEAKNITATKVWKDNFAIQAQALEMDLNNQAFRFSERYLFKKPITELYAQGKRCLENFTHMHLKDVRENNYQVFPEFTIPKDTTLHGELTSGSIDRLCRDEDGVYHVFDYKTGFGEWSKNKIANSNQLCWYATAIDKVYGSFPRTVGIWDLNKGVVTKHTLNTRDIDVFMRRSFELIKEKRRKDQLAEENIDSIPQDMGYNSPCNNCELLHEPDPTLRCPYKVFYED